MTNIPVNHKMLDKQDLQYAYLDGRMCAIDPDASVTHEYRQLGIKNPALWQMFNKGFFDMVAELKEMKL